MFALPRPGRDKAAANRRKHRVSVEEAATVFADPLSATMVDPDHSDEGESRQILTGMSERGRLLVVSHVERGAAVRLISARPATRTEQEFYEAVVSRAANAALRRVLKERAQTGRRRPRRTA